MDINEYILDAIDVIIDKKMQQLEFNSTIEGVVSNKVDNQYEIQMQNRTFGATALDGDEYDLGDVVVVLILNGDYSNKIILGRR